ncbi:MAG: DUF6326 family protein [Phototrophicaceae bacterium]
MNTSNKPALLSTLWIFVLFNMIFRDIHQFANPGYLEEAMVGVTPELLLMAGIVLEVQIAMVLLPRILPYRYNRWTNIIVSIVFIGIMSSFGVTDLDDIWFLTIEILALLAIIWMAWRWQEPSNHPIANPA